ncbi:MAG: DUF1064 domain-containing protein [Methylocella sp.]
MSITSRQLQQMMIGVTPKKSRYPVVEKHLRTVDGIVFASGREAKRYSQLKIMERAGEITHLTLQPAFVAYIGGVKFCTYTADFSYFRNGLDLMIVEDVKSSGTRIDPAYRLRKKAAEMYHGIHVTEVLMR